MPGDIEPKESKGGDQAGSKHILNEGRHGCWPYLLWCWKQRHGHEQFRVRRCSLGEVQETTSRLELAKVDRRGPAQP
jgi:hypothetical protein